MSIRTGMNLELLPLRAQYGQEQVHGSKHFDQRDLNSHTFRSEGQMTMSNRKSKQEPLRNASVPATPTFNGCQSPMSIRLSDMNCGTPEGMFSAELGIQSVETQTEDAPVRIAELASVE
ncbi:uncharacterized protein LOC120283410 [Dioscorea cayenensis subsp. rotundata]|uniref:Uncharacterized protein LOC120283410 n=1 Tax=Dioscorea cayennensis subsp. rotundata TaxID=55577 RepID=A0AB40D6U7_DIOCR|nr:uncharacterized protein LOC120283410 [Dioscorea cayenensis subsp. rotundata]